MNHTTLRQHLERGSFVLRTGTQYPQGTVRDVLSRVDVVVEWPDRTWSKHHENELKVVVR